LGGFWLEEVGTEHRDRLWIRGGLPRSFLARTSAESIEWRREFIRTFLERDLPQLGISIPAMTLRRFWTMLAHWHGQIWNSSEFARSFGVADTTVRKYLDTLSAAMVIRLLTPWHENLAKRQVKSPRFTSGTRVCFTPCWAKGRSPTWKATRKPALPGKDLPSNRSSGEPGHCRRNAISGQHMPGRNWTC